MKTGKNKKCLFCEKEFYVKRNINDWIALCAKCHYHYDRANRKVNITKERFPEKFTYVMPTLQQTPSC